MGERKNVFAVCIESPCHVSNEWGLIRALAPTKGEPMAAPGRMPEPLQPLLHRIIDSRARTDAIFEMISPAALFKRPIPERHRLIFYLGHLEVFDWNLLGRGAFELETENPALDKLFSFGIDPVSGKLPDDVPSDWPPEESIRAYNARVRQRLDQHIAKALASGPGGSAVADGTLLNVAIEHRLMHAETLAYLLHQLPFEDKRRDHLTPVPGSGLQRIHEVTIPEGRATLGLPRPHLDPAHHHSADTNAGFGWDNEFEATEMFVPSFAIGAYPVTNGDYLEFVRAGGYTDENLWTEGDWSWRESLGLAHPLFWISRGGAWNYRGMFEELPLPLSCPVYVSHAEASAYARWAGKTLPTEAQWHRAAYGTFEGAELQFPWGNAAPDRWRGNFNFASWDATPVASHPAGASRFGVYDLLGNGWEWTSTPFAPFPGFEPFPFYRGYSADFFDGAHFVMKGGSQRTAICMLRRSFRNWFQRHYPYVYAKFRCVED